MSEKRFKPYSVSTTDGDGFVIGIQKEDGTVMSITDASEMLNEQQATISKLERKNEQLMMENSALNYALKYVRHIEVDIDVDGVVDDE